MVEPVEKLRLGVAPPTPAQTGSLAVVVTLEENGCCSDFFSMKTPIFQFHFVFLRRDDCRPLCNLEGKWEQPVETDAAVSARVPDDVGP